MPYAQVFTNTNPARTKPDPYPETDQGIVTKLESAQVNIPIPRFRKTLCPMPKILPFQHALQSQILNQKKLLLPKTDKGNGFIQDL